MSSLHRPALAIILIWVCSAAPALAMGGKHPATQPIGNVHGDWPAALTKAINSPGRVAGHWVNANDEFFYQGDNKRFGEFIARLAETKLPLTLVVHTAPQRRSVLWGEEPRLPYDWSLLVGTAGWTSPAWKLNFDDPGSKYAMRVDVWPEGGLTPDRIDLPAGVRLSVERGSSSTTQPAGHEAAR